MSVDFGGAHPNHFYKTLSFDKDGNLISIEEFLKREFAGKNVVGKISTLTRETNFTVKLAENVNLEMIKCRY
jgi:hypothetical protein